MDDLQMSVESNFKITEIKEEPLDASFDTGNEEWSDITAGQGRVSALESAEKDPRNAEEEDVKPLVAVWVKEEREEVEQVPFTLNNEVCSTSVKTDYGECGDCRQGDLEQQRSSAESQQTCAVCNNSFTGSPLQGSNKHSVCYACKDTLSRNPLSHRHPCSGKKLLCSVCGKGFLKRSALVVHLHIHTGEKPFSCFVCKQAFAQKPALVVHIRDHTGEKPFQCSVCRKEFSRKGHFVYHMRTHTGEKFSCSECEKVFAAKGGLVRHMRIHTGERPYMCTVCQRSFREKCHLDRHVQRFHTGEETFKCWVCKETYSREKDLVRHVRSHEGEKPFRCSECEKGFSCKRYLVRHKRAHEGEGNNSDLKGNSVVELPPGRATGWCRSNIQGQWECATCKNRFSTEKFLTVHMRTHTGEKPFECSVCKRSFTNESDLVRHMHFHTGEKPFECLVCHKSFAWKSDLVLHLHSHRCHNRL